MPKQLHHSSLLVFLCVFVFGFASFQEVKATDDPLSKPHIWVKLQKRKQPTLQHHNLNKKVKLSIHAHILRWHTTIAICA